MFETSYSDSYGRRLRLATVHHEYGKLTLATAGVLFCVSAAVVAMRQRIGLAFDPARLSAVNSLSTYQFLPQSSSLLL